MNFNGDMDSPHVLQTPPIASSERRRKTGAKNASNPSEAAGPDSGTSRRGNTKDSSYDGAPLTVMYQREERYPKLEASIDSIATTSSALSEYVSRHSVRIRVLLYAQIPKMNSRIRVPGIGEGERTMDGLRLRNDDVDVMTGTGAGR